MEGNKIFKNAERRRTGWKTKDKRFFAFVAVNSVGNVVCCPGAHFFIIIFYNKFHLNHAPKLNKGIFYQISYNNIILFFQILSIIQKNFF